MAAFSTTTYRTPQDSPTSLFPDPASEKGSATGRKQCIESSKARSLPSALGPMSAYENEWPTRSGQLGLPISRPPFRLYRTQPRPSVYTKTRSEVANVLRSQRLDRSSTCFPQFSADRIKETNPRHIAQLWQKVMASELPQCSRPTKSSRSREVSLTNKSSRSKEDTATDQSSVRTSFSTTPSSTPPKLKTATVRDVDFEVTQLIPRGIEIHRTKDLRLGSAAGAHAYFGSDTPSNPDQSCDFYRSIVLESLAGRIRRDIDDSIFLSVGLGFIQSVHMAYRSLAEAGLPEPEYRAYALQHLFKGQYGLLANDTRRQLCAVRSVEWSVKPRDFDQVVWHTPPLLSSGRPPSKAFNFDIYPDCQFWLCDKILNPDYRESKSHVIHSKALGAFCPYYSIEFKATTDDTRIIVNQVAAAGSISLFSRYQLKLDAHPQPTPEQLKHVCHYGLTMEKESWTVWLFEPKMTDGTWAGCTVRNLDGGTCKTEQGVRRLLSWINEIHRWGLCEYALGCEDDVQHILSRARPNRIRVSATGT